MENISLKEQIQARIKEAMRAGDKPLLETLRLVLARITTKEQSEGINRPLTDVESGNVIQKMTKEREEVAKTYRNNNRLDLAEKEEYQISVLAAYLPKPYDEAQIRALVAQYISEGATSIKLVMEKLKPLGALVNGKVASTIANELLKAA